ncbi:MAG: ATP-binding protein [Candidatus Omnitrophota bacterium]
MILRDNQEKAFNKIIQDSEPNYYIKGDHQSGKTELLKALAKYYKEAGKTVLFIDGQRYGQIPNSIIYFIANELGLHYEEKTSLEWLWDQIDIKIGEIGSNLFLVIDELDCLPFITQGNFRALAMAHKIRIIAAVSNQGYVKLSEEWDFGSPLIDNLLQGIDL